MFDFLQDTNARPDAKIFTTLGALPRYIDRKQPPTKKQPWRAISEIGFVRSVEMILPDELYDMIWEKVEEDLKPVKYAKVFMKLQDVLDGDFFTEYIKKGNILMLSEGRPGVDNVFSLRDGVLRLELDKETYERAGLQGQPCRGGGRKHVKARYMVEVNLRQPSMLHGKKGFERIVWAARNVLNRSLTWLFYDLRMAEGTSSDTASPLATHHPSLFDFSPAQKQQPNVRVAPLAPSDTADNFRTAEVEEWSHDITEWLGLVGLSSRRIQPNDSVDPLLCRWTFPEGTSERATTLRVLRWQGIVDSRWVTQLLISCILHTKALSASPSQGQNWLALTVQAHPVDAVNTKDGYTILLTPGTGETELGPSTSVSEKEEPAQREQDKQGSGESDQGSRKRGGEGRGLCNFACFQFGDCLGGY